MAFVDCGHDPERAWSGALRKSGSAKRHVPGAGGDQLVDIGQHGGLVDGPHPAVVDDRHRAVPAAVRAAPAGLDRTDQPLLPVRRPTARTGRAAAADGGRAPAARRPVSWTVGPGSWPPAQATRPGLVLAGDHGVERST